MASVRTNAPSINAYFAAAVINRAAEIVAGAATSAAPGCDAVSALQQARDEFIAAETSRQKSGRTYAWPLLIKDIGEYVKRREPAYADSFTPLVKWSAATDAGAVAQTLREAALPIGQMVAERTRWTAKLDAMSEQERAEFELMWKAVPFLEEHGLTVQVDWDREDPNDPVDYRATVDGVDWAFELTELRIDAKGSHLTIGHPKERKSVPDQLTELAAPLPQVPDGLDNLQKALNAAVSHASKASKLEARNGAKYCLVLHNRRFLYAPDWEAIALPDFSAFDAVLILHQDSVAAAHTWEIWRNGFGQTLSSQNVSDLGDIAGFKLSGRPGFNPEAIRSFWRRMEESGITEAEIYEIVKQVRAGS